MKKARINQVLSFRHGWEIVKKSNYIKDILYAAGKSWQTWDIQNLKHPIEIWEDHMVHRGWKKLRRSNVSYGLGCSKDGLITCHGPVTSNIMLQNWLLQCNNHLVVEGQSVSLLLVFNYSLFPTPSYSNFFMKYMEVEDEVMSISPLPIVNPFVILEIATGLTTEVSIRELMPDSSSDQIGQRIRKRIEFPPELYEAGRGILSFFGSYLTEQYADQKAKVTIEQDDAKKTLRMTVTSESGDKEVIEKAYEEYRLIVSKQAPPEQFTDNDKLIVKLNTRIEILEMEVRQEQRLRMIESGKAQDYFKLLDKTLDQDQGQTVNVYQQSQNQNTNQAEAQAHAQARAKATAKAHQNLSLAIGGIGKLKNLLRTESDEAQELAQLQKELELIEEEPNPKAVKRSTGMSEFKRIIDDIASGESTLAKTVKAAKEGHKIFKDVAGKYNKIAQWCGLPVVPDVFL